MHLLYLDESGGVSETDQDYYVLGGISASERQPYFLCNDLDELQQKFFPGSSDTIEFHASAILNGNGEPWGSMAKSDRLSILNGLYRILASTKENVAVFAAAMHKPSFPSSDPIQRTCEEIAGHFDAYLTHLEILGEQRKLDDPKQRGLMIFDQTGQDKTLHALLRQYRTTGASFGRVKHLAEIPLFTDSRLTRMLQLADCVAYAVFRYYERKDMQLMDQILRKFHESGGKLHGLIHLVADYQSCFCPACMTRRASVGAH